LIGGGPFRFGLKCRANDGEGDAVGAAVVATGILTPAHAGAMIGCFYCHSVRDAY